MANAYNFSRRSRIPTTDGPPLDPPGATAPVVTVNPDLRLDDFQDTNNFRLEFTNTGASIAEYNAYVGPVPYSFIPNLQTSTFTWTVSRVGGDYYHRFRYGAAVDATPNPIVTGQTVVIIGGKPTNTPGNSDFADVQLAGA